jgi:starvation-inducible outer membrane lipoprotein
MNTKPRFVIGCLVVSMSAVLSGCATMNMATEERSVVSSQPRSAERVTKDGEPLNQVIEKLQAESTARLERAP